MNADLQHIAVPPPPTLAPRSARLFWASMVALPAIVIGVILANLPDAAPAVRMVGIVIVIAAIVLNVVGAVLLVRKPPPLPARGPYVLVPTESTWHQLGYPDPRMRSVLALNAYVNETLLDLVGRSHTEGVTATVVRSQLVAIHPRSVVIDGVAWWGIAIERVDRNNDLEFGINDDQQDVAAAEQRAIAVAAQLTRAMRVGSAP